MYWKLSSEYEETRSFMLAVNQLGLQVWFSWSSSEAWALNTGNFKILNGNGDGIHWTKSAQITV